MKRTIRTAAFAAVLIAGVASNANAVPIRIDFTGTVFSSYRFDANGIATADPTFMGQSVAGWFLIETEGLLRASLSIAAYDQLTFNDVAGEPELVTSGLTIGGTAFDVGLYGLDTGGIRYIDSNGPIGCGPGPTPICGGMTPDQMTFTDSSSQLIIGGTGPLPAPGTYLSRSLTLTSAAPSDPLTPHVPREYIDLSQNFDALTSAYLPLQTSLYRAVTGGYSESAITCVIRSCRGTTSLAVGWDITSVSRRVLNVPEPGTLALGALAILMSFGARRRLASSGRA